MHVLLSNLANRQTDRQTDPDKHRGQTHFPAPLSEVNNYCSNNDDGENVVY